MRGMVLSVLGVIVLIFALSGCRPGEAELEDVGEMDASRVVVGMPGDMPSPSPYASSSAQTQVLVNTTFSRLVNIDVGGGFGILPGLASSWESNASSTVWTFSLRDDVTFHSGHGFTADDVVFTFGRAGSLENEGIAFLIPGTEYIDQVVAADDYTVTFHLSRPVPDWPFYAASNIMSRGAIEEFGIEYGSRIGSGPFQFVNDGWQHGISWVVRRFDGYWGSSPPSGEIEFRAFTDPEQLAAALENGEVDAIFQPAPADAARLMASAGFNVFRGDDLGGVFLGINTEREAGANPDIRRAIAHAVDREAIVAAAYHGGATGTPSYNFINNATHGHVQVSHIPFDIAASMNILGELGFDTENRLDISIYAYDALMPAAVELQYSLSQSYFNVGVIELSPMGFEYAIAERGTFDIYLGQTFARGGTLSILREFFADGAHNLSGYGSAEYVALFESAQSAASMNELMSSLAQIQHHLAESVPVVPLVQQYLWVIGREGLAGVQVDNRVESVSFAGAHLAGGTPELAPAQPLEITLGYS